MNTARYTAAILTLSLTGLGCVDAAEDAPAEANAWRVTEANSDGTRDSDRDRASNDLPETGCGPARCIWRNQYPEYPYARYIPAFSDDSADSASMHMEAQLVSRDPAVFEAWPSVNIYLLLGPEYPRLDMIFGNLSLFEAHRRDSFSCFEDGHWAGAYTFAASDDAVLSVTHSRGPTLFLNPQEQGTSTVTITDVIAGQGAALFDFSEYDGQRCAQIFGEGRRADLRGTFEVRVERPTALGFQTDSFQRDRQSRRRTCMAGPDGAIRIIEGTEARVRYMMLDSQGERRNYANWTETEPFMLLWHNEALDLEVVNEDLATLRITSRSGAGDADLASPFDDIQPLKVLSPDAIASLELSFHDGHGRHEEGAPNREDYLTIEIRRIVLEDGGEPCNDMVPLEVVSRTPDTCAIVEMRPTRGLRNPTDYGVEFTDRGTCTIALSIPGSDFVQTHTIETVELP